MVRLALLVGAVVVVMGLCSATAAQANHEHPGAPCWSNGYGDGTDNDGWMHPYIHFTYDVGNCGNLAPQIAISAWFHPGAAGTAGWDRVFYKGCSFAFNCHHDLYPSYHECRYRAGLDGGSAFAHHYHYHHYDCTAI